MGCYTTISNFHFPSRRFLAFFAAECGCQGGIGPLFRDTARICRDRDERVNLGGEIWLVVVTHIERSRACNSITHHRTILHAGLSLNLIFPQLDRPRPHGSRRCNTCCIAHHALLVHSEHCSTFFPFRNQVCAV